MKQLKEALINKKNLKYSNNNGKISASKLKLSDLKEGNILIAGCGYKYVIVPVHLIEKYLRSIYPLATKEEYAFLRDKGWQPYEVYKDFPKNNDYDDLDIKYVYQYSDKFENVNDIEKYFKNVVSRLE